MMKNLKNWFGLAALMLAGLVASSCAREDVEVDGALPTKESAIYKHIADHKKERTRAGDPVRLEPVIYEGDTVMYIANYGEGWEVFSNSTAKRNGSLRPGHNEGKSCILCFLRYVKSKFGS